MSLKSKFESFRSLAGASTPLDALKSAKLHYLSGKGGPFLTYTGGTGSLVLRSGFSDLNMLTEQVKYGLCKLPQWYINYLINKQVYTVNILDLGANVGTSSLYLTNQLLESGIKPNIVGLEPDLQNYAVYYTNCTFPTVYNNPRLHYIQPVNAGIGSVSGTGKLYSPEGSRGSCSYRVDTSVSEGDFPILTMAQVVSEYYKGTVPQVVKFDIEGLEGEIFSGDPSWLEWVDILIIEDHIRLPGLQLSFDPVIQALSNYGYHEDLNYAPNSSADHLYFNPRLIHNN